MNIFKTVLSAKERLRSPGLGFVLAIAAYALPAQAEVWGYIDARGVAHFAAERVDERYELFFRDGQSPTVAPGAQAEYARPLALPTAPPKLLAFFEVSTNYKAVQHLLRDAGRRHNIDFELLKALISTESGFDTAAVSPKGAVGLMQLMPQTAARYGVRGDVKLSIEKKLTDPKTNIDAGTRYLRDLINLFPGKLDLALAAYNAGEGAVSRAGNQIPNYKETQNYVKTVTQLYTYLKPPNLVPDAKPREAPAKAPANPGPLGGAQGRGNMVRSVGEPTRVLLPAPPTVSLAASSPSQ